jgi:predicted nucleic acid-binding protein
VIVLDASAAVLGLLNDGDARRFLVSEDIAVPHLVDSEVAHSLRRNVRTGKVAPANALRTLERWAQLGLRRHPALGLWPRVWALRDDVTAYDGTYVALAEALGCSLVTGDARLAGAPGPTCSILVVRS